MAYKGKKKKYYWPELERLALLKELGKVKAYKTKGS